MDTMIKIQDETVIIKLKSSLCLEKYNHTYYSVHLYEYSPLENYYSPNIILDRWRN